MNASTLHDSLDDLPFENHFERLGATYFSKVAPEPLAEPKLLHFNTGLAAEIGLADTAAQDPDFVATLAGHRRTGRGSYIATVYAGHQFGSYVPQLGDGRALLIGQVRDARGELRELQSKGAGRTPYSRFGDGRAVLRSSIREYLCGEAMHALGIPTTRSLSLIGSSEPVRRETMETAAVICRVAPTHVRFGHFEYFYLMQRYEALRPLADLVIQDHFPELADSPDRYADWLSLVVDRTAKLMAQWQAVGFCHGVMNTDNMSILGLTLDYGPFQFLDGYDPAHICNHSDTQGRYAYARQPNIAYWNLFCLGQALLPLIGDQELALAALESYKSVFPAELERRMRAKLGLAQPAPEDRALIEGLLRLLAAERVDHTVFWRRLSHYAADGQAGPVRDLLLDRAGIDAWLRSYDERLAAEDSHAAAARMLGTNPKFVLRNHLGELAIRQAREKDFSGVAKLLALLAHPYDEHPGHEAEAGFPPDWAASIEISCSS
jgi:uncharacterized protein YdiU (UPF0061 family)